MDTPSIKYVALSALPPADVNPKKHDIEQMKASLRRFGMVNPIILNEKTGKLLAGHGRREALMEMEAAGEHPPLRIKIKSGKWHAPVLRGISFDNDTEARAYLLADNRLTEIGGWDSDALQEELKALADAGAEAVIGIGWSADEIEKLLGETADYAKGRPAVVDESEAERYIEQSIKQMAFFFHGAAYDRVVDMLDHVQSTLGVDNHSEVLEKLLEEYCAKNPMPEKAAQKDDEEHEDGDEFDDEFDPED